MEQQWFLRQSRQLEKRFVPHDVDDHHTSLQVPPLNPAPFLLMPMMRLPLSLAAAAGCCFFLILARFEIQNMGYRSLIVNHKQSVTMNCMSDGRHRDAHVEGGGATVSGFQNTRAEAQTCRVRGVSDAQADPHANSDTSTAA